MRGEVHILVYCPIDTLQWGSTHSAVDVLVCPIPSPPIWQTPKFKYQLIPETTQGALT